MSELPNNIEPILEEHKEDVVTYTDDIEGAVLAAGYTVVERNDTKPWGAYLRVESSQADLFVGDFFGDLTPDEARLGNPDAELSPKILIVTPGQRLSLQKHFRRAERWKFLTRGWYYKSKNETDPGELIEAQPGEVVQFDCEDVHRLCGGEEGFVVVAEIWQHVDQSLPSDEDDIVRLEDDYSR